MLLAALEAKKDVYPEKPLSKSLEESQQMIEAVRKSKQVVQIGMQRRSAESIMKAKKLVDDGVLGQITLVKPQWHWNVAKPLNNSPLAGQARLGPVPRAARRSALSSRCDSGSWRVFLGLCRRQHDGPGHPPDGRRAVVHEIGPAEVRPHARLRRQDERRRTSGRVHAPCSNSRTSWRPGPWTTATRTRTAGRSLFRATRRR